MFQTKTRRYSSIVLINPFSVINVLRIYMKIEADHISLFDEINFEQKIVFKLVLLKNTHK